MAKRRRNERGGRATTAATTTTTTTTTTGGSDALRRLLLKEVEPAIVAFQAKHPGTGIDQLYKLWDQQEEKAGGGTSSAAAADASKNSHHLEASEAVSGRLMQQVELIIALDAEWRGKLAERDQVLEDDDPSSDVLERLIAMYASSAELSQRICSEIKKFRIMTELATAGRMSKDEWLTYFA